MLNHIVLQGRLGSDPELKYTPNSVEVCTVNIAVDRDRKDANGERPSDWVTITAWRGTAKFLANNFSKGRMIVVSGRLQMRNYTDRDGNKRTAAEVVAENVYFCDSKKDDPLDGLANTVNNAFGNNFAELSDDEGGLPFN